MKKFRCPILLIGIVLLSNFKLFCQKKEVEIVFRAFPSKFLSDTTYIRKEIRKLSQPESIEIKLKSLVQKYIGDKVQICYYFDKTKYYIFYSNEVGQISKEIVTGTRGIDRKIMNETELISYWNENVLVFDSLKVLIDFNNGSLYGRTYFISKDDERNILFKKTQESLEISLLDSSNRNQHTEVITVNGKRSDTLHLIFVDHTFKNQILSCFKNLTVGNNEQADDLAVDAIVRLYSEIGLIDKQSLITYLSKIIHD